MRVRDKPGLRDMMAPYLAWGAAHDDLGGPDHERGLYDRCYQHEVMTGVVAGAGA